MDILLTDILSSTKSVCNELSIWRQVLCMQVWFNPALLDKLVLKSTELNEIGFNLNCIYLDSNQSCKEPWDGI